MQLTTVAIMCFSVVLAYLSCPVEGGVSIRMRKRGSCDGICKGFSCGTPNRAGRVVGGNPTEVNEYPWMVAFTYGKKLYCSGCLINDRYVLTAAHCLYSIMQSKVTLTFGSYNKTLPTEKFRQVRKIGSTWSHPQFQIRTFNNDVALIKLDNPVEITKEVRPICTNEQSTKNYEHEYGVVAGWGRMSEKGNASDIPREIRVPIMTNEECKKTKYNPNDITDNMMCAGYAEGKTDACQGDSGGPLMYKNGTSYEIIGVVSWGDGCARPDYPGVYTRLTKYWDVIQAEINKEESCTCPRASTH